MLKYTNEDFHTLMETVFQKYSSKNAVVVYDEDNRPTSITYQQIFNAIEPTGKLLLRLSLYPGDRIALITKPGGYAAVTCLILAMLGYTNVLLDASLPAPEINRLLKLSDVHALITTDDLYAGIGGEQKASTVALRLCPAVGAFEPLHLPTAVERRSPSVPTNTDLIAIIFSSGTTGTMKGVEITYRSMIYSAECAKIYATYNDQTKFLHVLPLNHIAGYTMLYITYLCGAEMGFMYELNAYYLAKGLTTYNPTHLTMIPKVFEAIRDKILAELDKKPKIVRGLMLNAIRFSGFIRRKTGIKLRFLTAPVRKAALGKNMLTCGSGTMPCREDIMGFYLNIGINFLDVYGATETGFPITATNCTTSKYPVSGAGNVRQFPFTKVKVNPETSEICVRSPMLMNGYYCDPEATKNAFDSEGYFKTGDCGTIDDDGILHITGRLKESIILRSGKKVSAADVDRYYAEACRDVKLAVCGVPDEVNHYDRIILFIETHGQAPEKIAEAIATIRDLSASTGGSYKIAEIRPIDQIPYTTIGKVKRYILKEEALKEVRPAGNPTIQKDYDKTVRGYVYQSLDSILGHVCIEDTMSIREDLCLDSLDMLDLCALLETHFSLEIAEHLSAIQTVQDLIDYIETHQNTAELSEPASGPSVSQYPLPLTDRDRKKLRRVMRLIRRTYHFVISGTEHLDPDQSYIFCPNHESHLDGLFCLIALNEKLGLAEMNCMAKQEHLRHRLSGTGLRLMGGIPVDRSGNSAPAMKRAFEVIRDNHPFLIHPEGTRTRNGQLGPFKPGAARLAIDTGHSLVPVCINGAYRIYPAHKKLPRLFDFRHFRKYTLEIHFGKPLSSADQTPESLTATLRETIVQMKEKYHEADKT